MRSRTRSRVTPRRRAYGTRPRRKATRAPRQAAGWYRRLYETPKVGRLFPTDEA